MGLKDLENFLSDQKEETFTEKEQKENRIKLWQLKVEKFYDDVGMWLKALTDKGLLKINYSEVDKTEEFLGTYKIRKMFISINKQILEVEPIGTLVLGAMGRIDLKGKNGIVRFVLVPKKSKRPRLTVTQKKNSKKETIDYEDFTWKILTSPPEISYIDLDSDTFSNVILDMIK